MDFALAARMKPNFYALVRDYMAQSYVQKLGADLLDHFEVSVSYGAGAGVSATVDLTLRETGERIKAQVYRDKDGNLDCHEMIDALEERLKKKFYWNTDQRLYSTAEREAICKELKGKADFKKYTYKRKHDFYIKQDTNIPKAGVFRKGDYEIWGSIFISNNKLKIFAEAYTESKDEGVTPYFYMTVSLLKYGNVVDSKGLDPGIRMDSLYPGRNIRMGGAHFNLEPASKSIEYELKIKSGYAYTLAGGKGWSKVARRNVPIEVVEVK